MATYLSVTNNVLCRLREATTSSVQSTSYSKMLGELVNDAKRVVEDAFSWSILFNSQDVTTVASTAAYDLSGTNERSTVYSVIATDGTKQLYSLKADEFQRRKYTRYKNQEGTPEWYKVDASGTSGVLSLTLLPTPQAVVTYAVHTNDPQSDLGATDDNTIILVPWQPIALHAYAYAIKERGEDQGQSFAEAIDKYEKSLARAIQMDSMNAPPKLWQVG